MLLHIIKHSRKSFYCMNCHGENFKLLGANTHLNMNKSPTLSLIIRCNECDKINTLPVFAVKTMEINENE